MRIIYKEQILSARFLPLAILGLAVALAACTPDLDDKLACDNSTQCPTGYFCGPDGKCQLGETVPEITVITPTTGITFSGVIQLEISAIDPAGITSVTASLSGPGSDGGAPIAATPGQGANIYVVSLDTRAEGIDSNGAFTATIIATNANGKTTSINVQLQVDDQPPGIGVVTITPAAISAGQATSISFSVSETITDFPVVKLTPPDSSPARHAAYQTGSGTGYTYQFVPLASDPTGIWHVQISASDSFGNTYTTSGADSFTVVAGGIQSISFTAVRNDSVNDARALYLKANASTQITATFGGALTGLPTAFLCPVSTPAPCLASSTGSSPATVSAGSAANSYSFTITAVPAGAGTSANNEGTHVVTVSGIGASGSPVSASTNVVFDFTAPSFAVEEFDPADLDSQGREMVSISGDGELDYFAAIDEPVANLAAISAAMDGTTNVPVSQDPQTPASLPQFTVTLDGSLKSAPPVADSFPGHHLVVTICDLANNCAHENSSSFVEIDLVPGVFNFIFPNEGDALGLPDGGDGTPLAFRPGQTLSVDVLVDRELGSVNPSPLGIELEQNGAQAAYLTQEIGLSAAPASYPATPFDYVYSTTIPADIADGVYEFEVALGYDGYGNDLVPNSPIPGVSPVFVTIKSSIPTLVQTNSAGGLQSGNISLGASSNTTVCFASQSGSAYDNLALGAIAACLNPLQVNGTLSCASVSPPSTGITIGTPTLSTKPVGPTGSQTANDVACIPIATGATPTSGSQLLLLTYTDQAGNVGFLANNLNISTTGPQLVAWSLDQSQVPPKGTAKLTVTFNDSYGLKSTAPGIPTGEIAASGPSTTVTIGAATPGPLGNNSYVIPFTMPASCNGGTFPNGNAPFTIGVTATDNLGNTYNSLTAGLSPAPTLACIPSPTVTDAAFTSPTTVHPGGTVTAQITVDEALGNIPAAFVTGNAGALTGVTAAGSAPNPTTPRTFTVTYTMPAACNGGVNPTDDKPFAVYVQLNDGSGAANTTGSYPIGNLTCANLPEVVSYSWNQTTVGLNTPAIATLIVNEPLTGAGGSTTPAYGSGLTISPLVTATPVSGTAPFEYLVTFTFTACGGSNQAPDGTPIVVNATLNDGAHTAIIPIGTLTCTTTSIATAAVNPQDVILFKEPLGDGTVRSVVAASPGALTGYTGSGTGIMLVATLSGVQVGAGALLSDGSVAEFELSQALTQVTLNFTDLAGHTPRPVNGYNEQLSINGTGAQSGANQNPFQVIDVGTGDDSYYAAPYWFDGGPGPNGIAGPVLGSQQSDGGGAVSASLALSLLASIDGNSLTVNTAPAFAMDAGPAPSPHQTYLGFEQYGNPVGAPDGGAFTGPAPAGRSGGEMVYLQNLVLMGGINGGAAADPTGTYWTWSHDSGWAKNTVTNFVSAAPPVQNFALGYDQNQNLLTFGGTTSTGALTAGITELSTNPTSGALQWTDAGTLGTPVGDGGVSPAIPVAINSSAYGSGYYAVSGGGDAIYPMTIMDTNLAGTNNCLFFVPGCNEGAGYYYCPNGNSVYSCANANGLAGFNHQGAALAVSTASAPIAGAIAYYAFFSFGGKQTSGNTNPYASNDLNAAQLSYNPNGIMTTTWTTLNPAAGSLVPPARSNASLYYIPQTNRLGLYGGLSTSNTALVDSWEFDLASNLWIAVDNPNVRALKPAGVTTIASTTNNGNLFMFGFGASLGDGWTIGRETRNRIIAKVPLASPQLTSPGSILNAQLQITVAVPGNNVGQQSRAIKGKSALAHPDQSPFDQYQSYDLYLWTNSGTWQYIATAQGEVQNVTIPISPSQITGSGADGNLYVMVTAYPSPYSYETPPPITLDALDFQLNFQ